MALRRRLRYPNLGLPPRRQSGFVRQLMAHCSWFECLSDSPPGRESTTATTFLHQVALGRRRRRGPDGPSARRLDGPTTLARLGPSSSGHPPQHRAGLETAAPARRRPQAGPRDRRSAAARRNPPPPLSPGPQAHWTGGQWNPLQGPAGEPHGQSESSVGRRRDESTSGLLAPAGGTRSGASPSLVVAAGRGAGQAANGRRPGLWLCCTGGPRQARGQGRRRRLPGRSESASARRAPRHSYSYERPPWSRPLPGPAGEPRRDGHCQGSFGDPAGHPAAGPQRRKVRVASEPLQAGAAG